MKLVLIAVIGLILLSGCGNNKEAENGTLRFGTNNTDRWGITSTGMFTPGADNTYDIGTSSLGVRNVYIKGVLSIGNTVNAVSPTSPNRTITIDIGGTTYYIPAKTTND